VRIIREYLEKAPDGKNYKYTLQQIAKKHEVSLGTVNGLVRDAKRNKNFKVRGPGRRRQAFLNARIMKILRDAATGITLEEVGELNPRVVMKNGARVKESLSRQRVSRIIKKWGKWNKKSRLRGQRFRPGDRIKWDRQTYTVVRYTNVHHGAAIDESDGTLIDPFVWTYQGARARLVKKAKCEMTPEEVVDEYLKRDSSQPPATANGKAA
jgi:hypothetical protein